jgi:hypothetical protein
MEMALKIEHLFGSWAIPAGFTILDSIVIVFTTTVDSAIDIT